jgi:formate dehydrogenase major subunit
MTNHWVDMVNADVVMIMGGNPAENHPIAMNWIQRRRSGARSCSRSTPLQPDVAHRRRVGQDALGHGHRVRGRHDPLRAPHDRVQWDYVRAYTTASFIVKDGFRFDDGLFSGYDTAARSYDKSSWASSSMARAAAARSDASASALGAAAPQGALRPL